MLATKPSPVSRTRPGRPTKAASAEIDARILDAAWQLFVERGYSEASIEAIAELAGVSRATIYQRHADKLNLFRAVITNRGDGWSKVASRMDWLDGDTLDERLRNYARQMLTWSQNSEISNNRRLSEGMRGEAGPLAHELEQSFRRRIADLLGEDIAKSAAREGMALPNARGIAVLVIGILEAIVGEAQRERHGLDWMIEQGVRSIDILLQGKSAW